MQKLTWPQSRHDFLALPLRLDDQTESFGDIFVDAHCMALPRDWIETYRLPLAAATAAMAALETGAIANVDEARMVGHYWLRDTSRAASAETAQQIREALDAVHSFAAAVHAGRVRSSTGALFSNQLIVGIGGSALGPQLASAALASPHDRLRTFFFDNTDPDGFDRTLSAIEGTPGGLAQTLVIVISKSGGTKETRNGQLYAKAAFARLGLAFERHAVAVTGVGSELDRTAQDWLARFPMWDFIGGRTSELSAVGLLPAALQGVDINRLLAGARAMDALTRSPDPQQNPAALLAVCWHHATGGQGLKDMVVLPYRDRFELFSRYLQQLVMESLGKEHDRAGRIVNQGIAVYGNKGSTDQHAYVQQLRDGVDNFFVTFIEALVDHQPYVNSPEVFVEEQVTAGDYLLGFLLGTQQALAEKGRRSLTITVRDCSAASLGALIALYERAVGIYAELVNINAYHQPGVEAGKKAAAAVLRVQQQLVAALGDQPQPVDALAQAVGLTSDDGVYTAWKILEHLAANGRVVRDLVAGQSPLLARYRRA
jgi:glucose-6-phosphate isomerase